MIPPDFDVPAWLGDCSWLWWLYYKNPRLAFPFRGYGADNPQVNQLFWMEFVSQFDFATRVFLETSVEAARCRDSFSSTR